MKSRKLQQVQRQERPTSAAGSPAVLHFTADRVLAGICFHLRDESLVNVITRESIDRSLLRLERERVDLSISRQDWEEMDHRERLNWLMSESHTVMSLAPGGVATLRHCDEE